MNDLLVFGLAALVVILVIAFFALLKGIPFSADLKAGKNQFRVRVGKRKDGEE